MTTETEAGQQPMYRALRLLERVAPPTLYNRDPYWRAPLTPPSKPGAVLVPSRNLRGIRSTDTPATEKSITVDINGAFLAAVGSVDVAHSQLFQTGRLDALDIHPRHVWPGYYRITVPHWAFDATLVSPLGDSARLETEKQVWVAHPTLVLLLELLAEGSIGDLDIHEAWVTEKRCNFRAWNAQLKVVRTRILDMRDAATTDAEVIHAAAQYKSFKEGYGAAFSMMLTGEKCKARRPDWAHAVYAQHAASAWRKAWRFTAIGPMLHMGFVDQFTVLESDLQTAITTPKTPPFRWDATGRTLGHVKRKEDAPEPTQGDEPTTAADERAADFFTQDFGTDE
jgi:hypothetical protein